MKKLLKIGTVMAGLAIASSAQASSHREAPAIAEDPMADNTDVYMFINPNDPSRMTIIANYVPLLIPSSGPNFYRFSDAVQYEIGIDNNGDAVADIWYRWNFRTSRRTGDTFLHNTGVVEGPNDPDQNINQAYTLTRVDVGAGRAGRRVIDLETKIGDGTTVPWYVGDRSNPNYDAVVTTDTWGDTQAFAGPRDEAFFVDLGVFDLLGVAGDHSTDGINVMTLAIDVPIARLAKDGQRPAAGATGPTTVVGVYARALRQAFTIIPTYSPTSSLPSIAPLRFGAWEQVSRLALPLVNEVVVPLKDKDRYNRSSPSQDLATIGGYALNPELNGLLSAVLGFNCSPTPAGGRLDIAGVLSPAGTTPADLLRIDIREGQTYAHSSLPNGRKLEDDAFDVMASLLCFAIDDDRDNDGVPDANDPMDTARVSDGVDANDLPSLAQFPFIPGPHSGNPL